jgi:L-2-hydroxyglutarate oxidase LhgO
LRRRRERLYRCCREPGVPYAQVGKLIVATKDAEIAGIERRTNTARGNGVDELQWLTAAQVQRPEPALRCVVALLSPSTGIIDSHALMLAFQGEAEAAGAMVVLRTPMLSGRGCGDGFNLAIGGDEPTSIRCRCLVNETGLYAPALARTIDEVPRETIPPAYFCRGMYFSPTGRAPFRCLVYPVPPPGGLRVHLTLDLVGQARFGPDIEWISEVDYTVHSARGEAFYAAIRIFWSYGTAAAARICEGSEPKISARNDPAVYFVPCGGRRLMACRGW